MRIGYDVSQTGALRAGCGYFADSLIRALARRATHEQFVLYPSFGDFFFDTNWEQATYVPERPNFARGLVHDGLEELEAFWSEPPEDFEEQLGLPDVVHSNNFFCPRGLKQARLVYTLYDLSFLENPEWTTEVNRRGCFDGVFRASLHADHIVAISQHTRRHFLETFPHYPEERVSVVPLGSRFEGQESFCEASLNNASLNGLRPDQYWLCVGTLEPRKNHARLLKAYAQLKARLGRTWPLVLAGGKGWLLDDLNRLIGELGLGRDVVMAGYVDDRTLQWLYENCHAALYPSLFEGFGLPVLEAMSLGAAVITSNVTSIPEVAGDAAELVNPRDEEEICAAMMRVTTRPSLRESLREAALRQARKFRWEDAARLTLECYERTALAPRLEDVLEERVGKAETAKTWAWSA